MAALIKKKRDLGWLPTVVVLAVVAAMLGLDMALCLVILMLAPTVTVVGYEILGHRDVVCRAR